MIPAIQNTLFYVGETASALAIVAAGAAVSFVACRAFRELSRFQIGLEKLLDAARIERVPLPELQEPPAPEPDESKVQMDSLASFIDEEIARKFAFEQESALAGKKEPRPERQLPKIPEGEVCSLMCSELSPEFAIQFHDAYFDVRYFVKGMLTQIDPVSPFTKTALSPEDLRLLCDAIGISPDDFTSVWAWPEEYSSYCKEFIELSLGNEPEISRIETEMQRALRHGWNESYEQLSQTRARLLSAATENRMRDVKERLRRVRFNQLAVLAELRGHLSSESLQGFQEAIPLENPLYAQDS